MNHTFGASLRGVDMVPDGAKALKSSKPAKRHQLSVCVLAERAETPDAWLKDLGAGREDGVAGELVTSRA